MSEDSSNDLYNFHIDDFMTEDYCKFGTYLLERSYLNKKIRNVPCSYRLVLKDFKKIGLNNFFLPRSQEYFDIVIGLIEKIHKSNIREWAIENLSKSGRDKLDVTEFFKNNSNFDTSIKRFNLEEVTGNPQFHGMFSNQVHFHIPDRSQIFIDGGNSIVIKDKYIKLNFEYDEIYIYCLLFYNGEFEINVIFKNKDIINPEFSYELEEIK